MLNKIDKKDRTWILLAALSYDKPIKLQPIDPDEETTATEVEDGGADVAAPAPTPAPLFIDVSRALDVVERCFLDNPPLLSDITACLQGVDINLAVESSTIEQAMDTKTHLTQRLA